jgi:hypothetical protein
VPDPRTQIVADGYDAIGDAFSAWREQIVADPRREWEDELAARLDPGSRVLALGCGSFPPEINSRPVRYAGFTIERDEVVVFEEPEGQARFQWVLARA